MKRNDKAILKTDIKPYWSQNIIPAGTELLVWRVKRNGTCHCTIIGAQHNITVETNVSNLEAVKRNVTMPKVGDLFYSSWGYEQTNIDFYQVTKVLGKSVEITRIAGDSKYDQSMAGHTKPVPGKFTGEPRRHLVKFDEQDRPYMKLTSYSSAWPTTADESHFFSEWH